MTEQFREAMRNAGIEPPAYIYGDGQIHRFHIVGRKSGSRDGAYQLHLEGHANGWFEDWRGLKVKWSSSDKSQPITKEMRKQFEENRRQREIEKQLSYQQAACTALYIWNKSIPVIGHPYLTRKKIKPHHTRLYRDSLVIPIYDESRQLINLQFITPDGDKRFLGGAKKKACFSAIRKDNNTDMILL